MRIAMSRREKGLTMWLVIIAGALIAEMLYTGHVYRDALSVQREIIRAESAHVSELAWQVHDARADRDAWKARYEMMVRAKHGVLPPLKGTDTVKFHHD